MFFTTKTVFVRILFSTVFYWTESILKLVQKGYIIYYILFLLPCEAQSEIFQMFEDII